MSARRRATYQRLVRWYPRRWRDQNAAVLVDTLESRASDEGRVVPSAGERWSIRAHGLAARATPHVLAAIAAVALVLSTVPVAVIWLGVPTGPWSAGLIVSAPFLGGLLTSIAAGGLLVRSGALPPERAVAAGALAIPAWTAGALATASWGVGFDEADAGTARSWFGDATLGLVAVACAAGTLAVAIVAVALGRGIRHRIGRMALAVVAAAPTAVMLGVATLAPGGMVLLSAAALVLTTVASGPRRTIAARPSARPRSLSRSARHRLAAVAAGAAAVGTGCVAVALTGSAWIPAVGDATQAMQIGILGGSLAAIPTVLTGAAALRPRLATSITGPTVMLATGLGLGSLGYAVGVNGPLGWPLLLVAAAFAGIAGGLLFRPVLPRDVRVRAALVAAISVALTATLGLMVATTAAFVAPVLAAVTCVALLRRPRSRALPVAA